LSIEINQVCAKIQLELLKLQNDLLAKQAFSDNKSNSPRSYLTENDCPNISTGLPTPLNVAI